MGGIAVCTKKQGCDGVLLFCPEQYYTGSETFYAETLEQCKIPVFSVTYAPAFSTVPIAMAWN